MVEDEHQVVEESEHSVSDGEDGFSDVERALDGDGTVDRAAESFLEVERELGHPEGTRLDGRAVDVRKLSVSEVPAEYPIEIWTDDALALSVEVADGETVPIYFEWSETTTDDRLGSLLELRDIPPHRFADLHGEEIPLTVENGHYVPVTPANLRGDERGIYGVLAGFGVNLFVALTSFFGLGDIVTSTAFVILWLVANFLVLPLSTFLDAWYIRSRTDWEGGPVFWATLAMIPAFNVLTVALYLARRGNADRI